MKAKETEQTEANEVIHDELVELGDASTETKGNVLGNAHDPGLGFIFAGSRRVS